MAEIERLDFSLFDLEKMVSQRNYVEFEHQLMTLLRFLDLRRPIESTHKLNSEGQMVCTHLGLAPFSDQLSFEQKKKYYSRLAAVITQYLSDSQHSINQNILIRFVLYKTSISEIFYLSSYGNLDHILFNRGLLTEDLRLNLQNEEDIKYLYCCLSLNSDIQYEVKQLIAAVPDWGKYWYMGMLYNYQHAYNSRIETNYQRLFNAHDALTELDVDSTCIEMLCSAWMLCSYQDREDRHDMKISINSAIQKWIRTQPEFIKKAQKKAEARSYRSSVQKIVVLSEQYTSDHAMYRCYHPEISSLKDRFHVTLISCKEGFDDISLQDFHDVHEVEDKIEQFPDIAKIIIKLEPDLILFPSLGMAKWTIPFANCRLAEYQVMCYGHPASACSDFIDYSMLTSVPSSSEYDFQRFCREKIIPQEQSPNWVWQPHPQLPREPYAHTKDGIVRIAVNSYVPKITTRFLNLCSLILQNAAVPVELHFFLIQKSDAFRQSVFDRFGQHAVVHEPAPYPIYMENLSRCDLALGTFPFGGSNTNIDVSVLGIPKIYYSEFCGLASYSDQTALDKLDLPDILKPKTESDLIANLIYLIHDENMRTEISQAILASNPYQRFFEYAQPDTKQEILSFVKAIEWIEESTQKETADLV